MMTELSLNILDVAQNSVRAGASLISISVAADTNKDLLTVVIGDDGCGMTSDQIANVEDPFFTTRTTRKVGLGVPFFKMAALSTDGSFHIASKPGEGTTVEASFVLSHIDRMPLGDINSTIHMLITMNTHIDFVYTYIYDERSFMLDTREFKEILGGIPLDTPDVSEYIKAFLAENKLEVDQGCLL